MLYRPHLVILGLKMAQKQIFGSNFQDVWQQKMLKTPFFGLFWGPKGYGGVCHRYLEKVTKFGLTRNINFRSNCKFLVGGWKTPPHRSRVKSCIYVIWHFSVICINLYTFIDYKCKILALEIHKIRELLRLKHVTLIKNTLYIINYTRNPWVVRFLTTLVMFLTWGSGTLPTLKLFLKIKISSLKKF